MRISLPLWSVFSREVSFRFNSISWRLPLIRFMWDPICGVHICVTYLPSTRWPDDAGYTNIQIYLPPPAHVSQKCPLTLALVSAGNPFWQLVCKFVFPGQCLRCENSRSCPAFRTVRLWVWDIALNWYMAWSRFFKGFFLVI